MTKAAANIGLNEMAGEMVIAKFPFSILAKS